MIRVSKQDYDTAQLEGVRNTVREYDQGKVVLVTERRADDMVG